MKDIICFKSPNAFHFKKISSKKDLVKDEAVDGYLIKSSESEARRIIDSLKKSNKLIAFAPSDNVSCRRAIETLKINFLVSPETGLKNDSLKQRDSGLNHVTAKEAAKKKIVIVIDTSSLSKLSGMSKAQTLSRIMQNISVCRKAHCSIKIASFAKTNKEALSSTARQALGQSLGMSSGHAKDAVTF